MSINIQLSTELEVILTELSRQQGVSAEELALDALTARFLPRGATPSPQDDWERRLVESASDCGVSLSHTDVSSDGSYD